MPHCVSPCAWPLALPAVVGSHCELPLHSAVHRHSCMDSQVSAKSWMALLRFSSGTLNNALHCCSCMCLHKKVCRALTGARLLSRKQSAAMRETSGALECLAPGLEVRLLSVCIAEQAMYTSSV